ncbi:hypothetical protein RD055328_00070 [Companilactobacillus sp. RD055328]|uniref:hypothetical protein n=1 Tax=Companilactobacillus sp. RD055328 TaxID=2916634 RepID=UPI001FC887AF|nr:hypothetical protein [Companilactobacillus sp. RD055328]GKQ42084.1 hypothetical protein RD055328_00070 [Companilactobacillus sp. RD055328]
MNAEKQELNLIEQITLNDGTKYYEIGNIFLNGRAELAAEKKLIKEVRILKMNIPHSTAVSFYEDYINNNYEMPSLDMTEWTVFDHSDPKVQQVITDTLKANNIKIDE